LQRQERSGEVAVRMRRAFVLLALGALLCPGAARAQDSGTRRLLGGLLGIGGHFLTSGSGQNALGDVKFASDTQLFVRPAHRGKLLITGGLEFFNASDHFLPFSGGNEFDLIGPSALVTTPRVLGKVRPFVSVGLFAGRVRSERLGFDRTDLTPSLAFGAEWPFARYFTLSASYRVSEEIHGVNTDGFTLLLRIF